VLLIALDVCVDELMTVRWSVDDISLIVSSVEPDVDSEVILLSAVDDSLSESDGILVLVSSHRVKVNSAAKKRVARSKPFSMMAHGDFLVSER
jgi:hypothetical protein